MAVVVLKCTNLEWTTFPRILFHVCFQLGWSTTDIFAWDLEGRRKQWLYWFLHLQGLELLPIHFVTDLLAHLIGRVAPRPITAPPCPGSSFRLLGQIGKGTDFSSTTPTSSNLEAVGTKVSSSLFSKAPACAHGFQLIRSLPSPHPAPLYIHPSFPTAWPVNFEVQNQMQNNSLFNSYLTSSPCNKVFLLLWLNPYNSIGICLILYETAKLFWNVCTHTLSRVWEFQLLHILINIKIRNFVKTQHCKPKQANGPPDVSLCSEPCPCRWQFHNIYQDWKYMYSFYKNMICWF